MARVALQTVLANAEHTWNQAVAAATKAYAVSEAQANQTWSDAVAAAGHTFDLAVADARQLRDKAIADIDQTWPQDLAVARRDRDLALAQATMTRDNALAEALWQRLTAHADVQRDYTLDMTALLLDGAPIHIASSGHVCRRGGSHWAGGVAGE